ncbi:hypothetical protein [uncultured Rikenella sp.]|uniref:hypothetical protein n=2 Tax=uncultured Rikenella sp. TaxID=368003 RepID=UPI00262F5363|nr:hypothetical protein [uncultured Rikenella sp.]
MAMEQSYYTVTYRGTFGFIKPWFAVRDSRTYSLQFLTPSIVEGIRQKLEVGAILRHKLTYAGFSVQQEQTQPRGWEHFPKQKRMARPRSILNRGVLLSPVLTLAFASAEEAERAASQHICLCRNEDILFPEREVGVMSGAEFDALPGYELRFCRKGERGVSPVGFNRFSESHEMMYGRLEVAGNPIQMPKYDAD